MAEGSPLRTVYTTLASEKDAVALARGLLADRLIACANILPLRSVYRWKGEVVEEPETGMLLKTTEDRLDALLVAIPARHPYEVPCVEVWPVEHAHVAFGAWVRDMVVEGPETGR